MEDIPAANLRKIPDKYLENVEKNDSGTIYDDLLTQLQIRPESCRLFFEQNLRPFRNKAHISKLIARGTDLSLRQAVDHFLPAFGQLVWQNNRGWLLRPNELQTGEEPLFYILPKDRLPRDHEVFYSVLKQLWQRMRNAIYEVKNTHRNPNADEPTPHPGSARAAFGPYNVVPPSTEENSQSDGDMHAIAANSAQLTEEHLPKRYKMIRSMVLNSNNDVTIPRYYAPPPPPNEVRPDGFWPASRTQEAIMNIIVGLHETRKHSHPEVFEAAYEEHSARLAEWEKGDRLSEPGEQPMTIPEETDGHTSDRLERRRQQPLGTNTQTTNATGGKVTGDVVMQDANPLGASNPSTHLSEPRSFIDAHMSHTVARFPLSMYLPPVLPYTMSISITPFRVPPSSSNVQPFLWPLAPVSPDSYGMFIEGVRLRAGVPDAVKSERLAVVLGYGWNDFSRLVRGDRDWRNGVMGDLNDASQRLGVRVWRARCCVFAA